MVYLEKSQPAPECLAIEKTKSNGNYKCDNVLERLKKEFNNKCYICEFKEPTSINVEHFKPHRGDKNLMFDWNNLFLSCSHCNNIKLDKVENILNCTVVNDNVGTDLKYLFKPFPFEMVDIQIVNNDDRVINTQRFLLDVYNGTTKLKAIESSNLRNKLLDEIMEFQGYLRDYFCDTNNEEDKQFYLIKIKGHLSKASNFTAFKRWIIFENERLKQEFNQYID